MLNLNFSKGKDASSHVLGAENPFSFFLYLANPKVVVKTGLGAVDAVKPLLFAKLLNGIFLEHLVHLKLLVHADDAAFVSCKVKDFLGDEGAELLEDGDQVLVRGRDLGVVGKPTILQDTVEGLSFLFWFACAVQQTHNQQALDADASFDFTSVDLELFAGEEFVQGTVTNSKVFPGIGGQ